MIAKLLRFPGELEKYVRRFGWVAGTRLLMTQLAGRYFLRSKLQRLRVPGYPSPVTIRPQTTDYPVLRNVLVDQVYAYEAGDARFIIDCGAHIGITPVYFANKYPRAMVYAIEAQSENFELLKENTKHYPNIKCFHAAIWPTTGKVSVTDPSLDTWGYRISREVVSGCPEAATVTVDELLAASGFDRIDLLKLNIEGAEKELFSESCHSWLSKTDMIILCNHDHFVPFASQPCLQALNRYNYWLYPDKLVIDKKPITTMFPMPPVAKTDQEDQELPRQVGSL